MARSLTVQHDETPSTSSLLTVFLLLAFAWMAVSAISAGASEPSAVAPTQFDGQ